MTVDPAPVAPRRGLRTYPAWALILLLLGWAIVAVTLAHAVDFALPILTDDIYGRWVFLAGTGVVATIGIAAGLALVAIAGAGRRDGKTGRWKLWAKLLLLLGAVLCIEIPLLMIAAGQFASIFADLVLFFGWIPFVLGALLILAALIWGRRR
ncbi:hypothetical protein [Dongia sp.]|uniref:hypothetical protein n=1 Tax=Dongia sp. TaxID=1977262 RepID=UPI0037507D92